MFSSTCSQRGLDLVARGGDGRSIWRRSCGARCRVSSTRNVHVQSLGPPVGIKPLASCDRSFQVSSLLEAVSKDLQQLNKNIRSKNLVLASAAEQIFGAGGKRLRPALVFLVSRATAQIAGLKELTTQHQRLAEIIEMIHTASLMHDDVIDESGMRRGKETIHQLYGTRVTVLAGDFMFAQSSWYLANLENVEVIKLISQVIKDFASGEIQQDSSLFNCDLALEEYSYIKDGIFDCGKHEGCCHF